MYFVYIIYSEKFDKYYIGQTNDINRRLSEHNNGKSDYTKPYMPWILVLAIQKPNRSEAVILERKIKNLSRTRLLRFINKYSDQEC